MTFLRHVQVPHSCKTNNSLSLSLSLSLSERPNAMGARGFRMYVTGFVLAKSVGPFAQSTEEQEMLSERVRKKEGQKMSRTEGMAPARSTKSKRRYGARTQDTSSIPDGTSKKKSRSKSMERTRGANRLAQICYPRALRGSFPTCVGMCQAFLTAST